MRDLEMDAVTVPDLDTVKSKAVEYVTNHRAPNELRVTVYDPSRGVPVAELEVIKIKDKLRHG